MPLMKMSSAFSIIRAVALLLLVINFTELCSSLENNGSAGRYLNSSITVQHGSLKELEIEVHGILFWASMGFLMPVGILCVRISSSTDCCPPKHKILFYVHAALQVVSVLLVTVGAVLSVRQFENAFNNIHQRTGLALYVAVYLQVLIGFIRPNRETRCRKAWYFLHWMVGTSTSLVGIVNVYTGLQAYHKRTDRNTSVWTIVFTAQVCVMVILFLVQDRWTYIQKQGLLPVADNDGKGCSPAQPDIS